MSSGSEISAQSVRTILELEMRRFAAGPFWPILLLGGIITAPLSLSPYVPKFLPAMACGLLVVERNIMDMFGAREKDLLRFVALPLSLRDIILAKGIVTTIKAVTGAFVVAVFHAWLAWPAVDFENAAWTGLCYLFILPLLLQMGATVSLDALRSPVSGALDVVVRSITTLLAGLTCAALTQAVAALVGSFVLELLFVTGAFVLWVMIGTRASALALDRWIRSAAYTI